jgi:hypothetical protein
MDKKIADGGERLRPIVPIQFLGFGHEIAQPLRNTDWDSTALDQKAEVVVVWQFAKSLVREGLAVAHKELPGE